MMTSTVHVAVFDTFADWETGYATAHIRRGSWQREPGRYSVATVGLTREPVTTMGGSRFVAGPVVADGDLITASGVAPAHFARAIFERLGIYTPEVAASWFKLYADRDPAGFYELMAVPAGQPA